MRPRFALRPALFCVLLTGLALACGAPRHAHEAALKANLAATPLSRGAEQLTADVEANLAAAGALRATILAVSGARTIENTLRPLDRLYLHLGAASSECSLFEETHPDPDVREAASAGRKLVAEFSTDLSLDRGIYDAIAAVDLAGADAALRHAVQRELLEYRLAGVDRDDATRARLRELNETRLALGQEFQRRVASDRRSIEIAPEDLAGLPADFIANHPADEDGVVRVWTVPTDYGPFMSYAESAAARERLYVEYNNRGGNENVATLEKLIEARHETALLLGFPSWAAHVTANKMIGSAEAAATFIDAVAEACREPADRDLALLLEEKRKDDPTAQVIHDWEKSYYANRVRRAAFDFDSQAARPYFQYERVQQGIFDLTSRLFGVRIVAAEGLALWHEDVTAWDMFDADGSQVGRFFLDMHPRDDKYTHAACFPYRNGVRGVQLPQATLVCNFPNPREAEGGIALMEFSQVSTYLHEFGHLIHHLFAGRQEWGMNAGISNEWDFVEAPSQILEEWLLDTETLQSFALHYQTNEPIPEEMIERIRASSEFGKGVNAAHQVFYAALSLNSYNRAPPLDTGALVAEMQERYSPFPYVPGTQMQASFGHLVGYSAIYYTYKWSEVIAKDLFSRFEREGLLDPGVAKSYREMILEPGGSKPAAELVRDFLGRESSFEAYREWLQRAPEPRG